MALLMEGDPPAPVAINALLTEGGSSLHMLL